MQIRTKSVVKVAYRQDQMRRLIERAGTRERDGEEKIYREESMGEREIDR